MSLTTIDTTQEISMTPAIANPTGKKVADRVASIMVNASALTALALINEKGAIGKQAREVAGKGGVLGIVNACANSNFKPLVDFLAIKLNAAVMVRNRSEYEALPYLLDLRIMDAQSKGTATGDKLAVKLHAIRDEIVNIQAAAADMRAKRAAQAEADKAAAIAN